MSAKLERTQTPGIYKRGSRYLVTYRDPAGRQRRQSAGTLKEARAIKSAHTTDVNRGEFVEQSKARFDEYAKAWVDRYQGRRGSLRETTRAEYRRAIEERAIPFFGRMPLSAITPVQVGKYVEQLCAERITTGKDKPEEEKEYRPPSDSSIANAMKPVRACLASAVREGLIRHNPCADVILPRREDAQVEDDEDTGPTRALTRDQLRMFLSLVDKRYRLFFRMPAETGLRVFEIIALDWRHLELDGSDPHLKARQALVRGKLHPPKSKYGRRRVPLSFALVDELHAARRDSEWGGSGDPVFATRAGTRLSDRNVRDRQLDPVMGEIGADGMGFHSFRHLCASMLFARGANPVQVQRWLGHHSAAFTLATYVHLLKDEGAPALDLSLELQQQGGNTATTDLAVTSQTQPE